jgi:hypothetical protein
VEQSNLGVPVERLERGLLYFVEGRVECRSPGNGMRTLESRAGKDFVARGFDGRSVGEESSVEFQHFQQASELADNLRRGTGMKIGYAFGERLGTVGRDLVA